MEMSVDIHRLYYPYTCVVCLKSDPDIKRCSNCKVASYCSKEHQNADWHRSHKYLCKAISECNKRFNPNISDFEDWTNYRMGRRYILENTLGRELSTCEMLMNQFSPICAKCFSREELYCCRNCFSVSYCSKEHELQYLEKHKLHCESFKINLLVDQYINLKGLPDVEFCTVDTKTLSCTRDILKHVKLTDFTFGHQYLTEEEESIVLDIIKVERITLGLNLLNALNISKCTEKQVIIHIVGASTLELESNWSVITQILFNWLGLSYVTYHFIGPDLKNFEINNQKFDKYELVYHPGMYHEIFNKINKPNLIAAFNCGLHEWQSEKNDPWLLSIPRLLHFKKVPLLLTSFTEIELVRDRNIVTNVNCKLNVLVDVEKNPFSFLKPLRDWLSESEPIFYRCNYFYIAEKIE